MERKMILKETHKDDRSVINDMENSCSENDVHQEKEAHTKNNLQIVVFKNNYSSKHNLQDSNESDICEEIEEDIGYQSETIGDYDLDNYLYDNEEKVSNYNLEDFENDNASEEDLYSHEQDVDEGNEPDYYLADFENDYDFEEDFYNYEHDVDEDDEQDYYLEDLENDYASEENFYNHEQDVDEDDEPDYYFEELENDYASEQEFYDDYENDLDEGNEADYYFQDMENEYASEEDFYNHEHDVDEDDEPDYYLEDLENDYASEENFYNHGQDVDDEHEPDYYFEELENDYASEQEFYDDYENDLDEGNEADYYFQDMENEYASEEDFYNHEHDVDEDDEPDYYLEDLENDYASEEDFYNHEHDVDDEHERDYYLEELENDYASEEEFYDDYKNDLDEENERDYYLDDLENGYTTEENFYDDYENDLGKENESDYYFEDVENDYASEDDFHDYYENDLYDETESDYYLQNSGNDYAYEDDFYDDHESYLCEEYEPDYFSENCENDYVPVDYDYVVRDECEALNILKLESTSKSKPKSCNIKDFILRADKCNSCEAEEVAQGFAVLLPFYSSLLDDLMQCYSVRNDEVVSAVQHLSQNYSRVVNGRTPVEIDYTNIRNCIGYLHRYAACHTALVWKALNSIFENPSLDHVTSKLTNKRLNTTFLGGGPGNDFVGFLNALYGKHQQILDLDVTVVDKMAGWKDVFNQTINKLKHFVCGKTSCIFDDVNVTTSFITADLKQSSQWNNEIEVKLKSSDIVFLVKFLSHVPDEDKLLILMNIVTRMKSDAVLVYIDSPYPEKVFSSLSCYLKPVYKSVRLKYYFKFKRSRFGSKNITKSTASVRVFVKY